MIKPGSISVYLTSISGESPILSNLKTMVSGYQLAFPNLPCQGTVRFISQEPVRKPETKWAIATDIIWYKEMKRLSNWAKLQEPAPTTGGGPRGGIRGTRGGYRNLTVERRRPTGLGLDLWGTDAGTSGPSWKVHMGLRLKLVRMARWWVLQGVQEAGSRM